MSGGALLTKPFTFTGNRLSLNFATSAVGSVRVELRTADDRPIVGFKLDDCAEMFGDSLDRTVTWTSGPDVNRLIGQPVRMFVELKDADLFSFCFSA